MVMVVVVATTTTTIVRMACHHCFPTGALMVVATEWVIGRGRGLIGGEGRRQKQHEWQG